MEETILGLQTSLMRNYYKYFSKYARGRKPEQKVAWITSFAPVEILEALDILYYYPESYAAVIAASDMDQEMLESSENGGLSCDCCSYSCCVEGCLNTEAGPRGVPPAPDILIATNNQCNTLPGWWNILAERYNVPLIVIDYPGENINKSDAYEYVTSQHKELINELEKLTGNRLDLEVLNSCIEKSIASVTAWSRVVDSISVNNLDISSFFDDIFYLLALRCKEDTAKLFNMMADEAISSIEDISDKKPLFMIGYPLWYSPERYFKELLEGFRVCGSNYITWWILDYSGEDAYKKLFNAYNYTFLNLSQDSRNKSLSAVIEKSGAVAAVTLRNKSCKCDYVSARNISVPQAEIEIDMIDRKFMDIEATKRSISILRDLL